MCLLFAILNMINFLKSYDKMNFSFAETKGCYWLEEYIANDSLSVVTQKKVINEVVSLIKTTKKEIEGFLSKS